MNIYIYTDAIGERRREVEQSRDRDRGRRTWDKKNYLEQRGADNFVQLFGLLPCCQSGPLRKNLTGRVGKSSGSNARQNESSHFAATIFFYIRKEAWPFYRTIPGVRLCWELEEPEGSPGYLGEIQVGIHSEGYDVCHDSADETFLKVTGGC